MSGSRFKRAPKDECHPFVMVSTKALHDEQLSLKAKGLLALLLSFPDDWQIYETHIVKLSQDGKASLKSGIKELMDYGYLTRKQRRNINGQFKGYDYMVYEYSIKGNDRVRKSDNGKSDNGKSDNGKSDTTNINYTNNNRTKIKGTNIVSASHDAQEEEEKPKKQFNKDYVIDTWNSLDSRISKVVSINYGTKRYNSLKARVEEYGEREVIKAIQSIDDSEFLKGNNDRGWKITFDWFVKPNNFIKVLEGNYIEEDTTNHEQASLRADEEMKRKIERAMRILE